jgi:hypothetical protein
MAFGVYSSGTDATTIATILPLFFLQPGRFQVARSDIGNRRVHKPCGGYQQGNEVQQARPLLVASCLATERGLIGCTPDQHSLIKEVD